MKENIFRGTVLLSAFLLLLFFWFLPFAEKNNGSVNNGRDKYSLPAGESLSWEWMPEADQVTEAVLRIAGKKEAQNAILKVEVKNANGETVSSLTQAVSEMGDTDEIMLEGAYSGGKIYVLRISVEGEDDIKIRGTETETGFQPSLSWNGIMLKRDRKLLYFAAGCLLISLIPLPAQKKSKGRIPKWLFLSGLIILSTFWMIQKLGDAAFDQNDSTTVVWMLHYAAWLYFGIMGKLFFGCNLPLEKKSAIGIMMIGILFLFAIQPKSPPDEKTHFNYAYKVSNFLLFKEDKTTGDARDYHLNAWVGHVNSADGYDQVLKGIMEKRSTEEEGTFSLTKRMTYPLMYLPQAVGLAIGRLFRVNSLILFYLGRFFNLLFYMLCIYFAVKVIPEKKELFFGIGMMPMAIHQAASFSYDAFTNGMAILWTALVFSAVRNEKPLKKREYLSMLVVGTLMAPAKVGYAVLAGLLFLIPQKRFVVFRKQTAVWGIILTMVISIAGFWLPSVLNGQAIYTRDAELFTFHDFLRQPLHIMEILSITMEEGIVNWLREAIGNVFSGYNLWIPSFVPVIYLFILFVLTLKKTEDRGKCISFLNRLVILGIMLICVLMIESVELISWTEVTSRYVSGIQGRYFIPIIPVAFLSMENKSIRINGKTDERKLLWLLVFLQVITMDNILVRTLWV